jgi:hypothetical protein
MKPDDVNSKSTFIKSVVRLKQLNKTDMKAIIIYVLVILSLLYSCITTWYSKDYNASEPHVIATLWFIITVFIAIMFYPKRNINSI